MKLRESLKRWLATSVVLAMLLALPVYATNITEYPLEDDYLEELTQSLGGTATDVTINVDTTPVYSPTTTDTYMMLEPGTARQELVVIDDYDSSASTITIKTASRGQDLYLGDSRSTKIFEHPAGSEIIISDNYAFWEEIKTAVNTKLDQDGGNTTTTFDLDVSGTNFRIRKDGSDMKFTDDNQAEITLSSLAALSGVNDKTKISATDTTEDYLQTKITARGGLAESVGSPAGDERLLLDLDLTANTGNITAGLLANIISDVSATAAEINQALDGVSANVTDTNLNTLTAGTTSAADALHTHTATGVLALTAGEAIDGSTTPQALAQTGENYKKALTVHMAGTDGATFEFNAAAMVNLAYGEADATTWRAQSFTITDADADAIALNRLTVWLEKKINGGDTFIEIQGDDSNKPDGAVITNGTSVTKAAASITANARNPYQFTWTTPPALVSGTKYWFVIKKDGANSAANYLEIAYENADNYSGHSYSTYTASTLSWSTAGSVDILFHMELDVDYGNKVYKLDTDNMARANFIGFTEDNVAAAASVDVLPPGQMQANFTGLAVSDAHYGTATAGAIGVAPTTAANTVQVLVGKARSATQLFTQDGIKRFYSGLDGSAFDLAESSSKSVSFIVPCGFRPTRLRFVYNRVSTAGNDAVTTDQTYTVTAGQGGVYVAKLDGSFQPVATTTITSTASTIVAVSSVFENAFRVTVTQATPAEQVRDIRMWVEGY